MTTESKVCGSPQMSINDNTLETIGKPHPAEPRKTECVLYPEMGQETAPVLPRPQQGKRRLPDELS